MIALLVMTDGRLHHLQRTVPSFMFALDRPDLVTELWIHDDSGDPAYREALVELFGPTGFRIVSTPGRSGFGGAIRSAWSTLRAHSTAPFIFHLEDDFVFHRTIPLSAMVKVLEHHPHLAQMALRRQPWNDAERAAGGVVEQHPEDYSDAEWWYDVYDRAGTPDGYDRLVALWLEHRRFFTTNPCLYRRSLMDRGWPDGVNSEGRFGIDLFADGVLAAGYWGARGSGEWCEHIGVERVGTGY